MKFTIVRSKFLEGLKSVQNVVAAKGSLPVLQNVLLKASAGKLVMTTTDLDVSILSEADCEVAEEGATTLPVKLLSSSVLTADEGLIEISTDAQERATIVAGSARFKIAGLPATDFPALPEDEDAYAYVLPKQTLREMLRKTAYAASQDDTRRTLKGVLMSFKDSKLTMVATDGRRLALIENEVEFPVDAARDVILPSKAVQELQRLLNGEGNLRMKVQQSQICFDLGSQKIYSKLMDDSYPNYAQVIPSECSQKVIIDRQLLINAIGRASVMTMDEQHSIRFVFEGNRLTVSSAASEVCEAHDEVAIKYAGEKIEILFNPSYVLDPLKAIDDDEISFNLNNGHTPAVIRCSSPFLYVLMPLRVS